MDDDGRTVEVTRVLPDLGTLWFGEGTDTTTGEHVSFAGDARTMAHLAEVLDASDDPILATVPSWAIRQVTPA